MVWPCWSDVVALAFHAISRSAATSVCGRWMLLAVHGTTGRDPAAALDPLGDHRQRPSSYTLFFDAHDAGSSAMAIGETALITRHPSVTTPISNEQPAAYVEGIGSKTWERGSANCSPSVSRRCSTLYDAVSVQGRRCIVRCSQKPKLSLRDQRRADVHFDMFVGDRQREDTNISASQRSKCRSRWESSGRLGQISSFA